MGATFSVTESVEIARPSEDVYAYAADYRNDIHWRQGVAELTVIPDGRAAVGTMTTEVLWFLGRRLVTKGEMTEAEANRKIAFRSLSGPISVSGYRLVEAAQGATRLTFHLKGELDGLFSVFAPVLRPVFRRQVRADLRRLQARLQSEQKATGVAGKTSGLT